MFRLAPFGPSPTKPDGGRERRHLTEVVEESVERLLAVPASSSLRLTQTDASVRGLIIALDALLIHGLLDGSRTYWPAVREFLARRERAELVRSWQARSPRSRSIAWLLHCINEGILEWQLLSFRQGRKELLRFYYSWAAVLDPELLRRIADAIAGIVAPFDLRPAPHDDDVPLARPVVLDSASGSRRHDQDGQRRRQLRREIASPPTQTTPVDHGLEALRFMTRTTSKDRDFIFSQIVQMNHHRFGNRSTPAAIPSIDDDVLACTSLEEHYAREEDNNARMEIEDRALPDVVPSRRSPPTHDAFDDALRKVVKVDESSNHSDSVESLLSARQHHLHERVHDLDDNVVDGEIPLDSGELVQLGLQVFRSEGERLQRLFLVYLHHGTGMPLFRVLLVTNYAVYLLTQSASAEDAGEAGDEQGERGIGHASVYKTETVIALSRVSYLSVGFDAQTVSLELHKGERGGVERGAWSSSAFNASRTLTLGTGSGKLSWAIVTAILKANEKSSRRNKPLDVVSDATPHALILRRWAAQELSQDAGSIVIRGYFLVYWREVQMQNATGTTNNELSGFLYYRSVFPSAWIRTQNEWNYNYFLLSGHKLYQFQDSTCKIGERIIDIRSDVIVCGVVDLRDEQQCVFEIELVGGNERVQFACASRELQQRWIAAIVNAQAIPDRSDEMIACAIVVTDHALLIAQEGANCAVDGFMRRLSAIIHLDSQCQITAIRTDTQNVLVCERDDKRHWLSLRSAHELQRCVTILSSCGAHFDTKNGDNDELTIAVSAMPDLWNNTAVE